MIECPNCHTQNEDDRAGQACEVCGEPLPREDTVDGSSREDNPFGKLRSLVELSEPQDPEADAEEKRKRERGREVAAQERDESSEELPLDPNHLDAITEYGSTPIVSVIGFGSSGKSFFVNRLRQELPRGPWKRWPPPEKKIGLSPEGIVLTHFVPTDVHLRRGRNHGYVVVDCAGESFVQALERQFTTGSLEGVLARSYLAAVALASAYILVIRAEDLLPAQRSEDNEKRTERRDLSEADRRQREFIKDRITEGFEDIINTIVVSRERLRSEGPAPFLRKGLSREELKDAFKRNQNLCEQPLCVVFSQADRLEKVHHQDDAYDSDPFHFALEHAPTLVNAIHRTFRHYRFDYLSAFYGHDADALDEDNRSRPDYTQKSYGAREAFNWLHGLLTPRSKLLRPLQILKGEIPTRHLVKLRRKVDPVFDRQWRETWTP